MAGRRRRPDPYADAGFFLSDARLRALGGDPDLRDPGFMGTDDHLRGAGGDPDLQDPGFDRYGYDPLHPEAQMLPEDRHPLDPSAFPGYRPLDPLPPDPSALPSRQHPYYEGFDPGRERQEPLPAYRPDLSPYFSGLASGQQPQNTAMLAAARRPAWLDRLGDVGDAIAAALANRKLPYLLSPDTSGAAALHGGGGGQEAWRFDPDKPGHLGGGTMGSLYLQQLAQQIAAESMRRGQPLRSSYRPTGGGTPQESDRG